MDVNLSSKQTLKKYMYTVISSMDITLIEGSLSLYFVVFRGIEGE